MSTVGYGDRYPVTTAGRELGTLVIVVGVGIFGTLTGYLANLFLSPDAGPGRDDAARPRTTARRAQGADGPAAGGSHSPRGEPSGAS